jgi:hypothetical protein
MNLGPCERKECRYGSKALQRYMGLTAGSAQTHHLRYVDLAQPELRA